MSEQNSSGFPFAEVPDSTGLDIDAIFGGAPNGGAPGNVNPFDAAPQPMAQQPVPAPPVFQSVQPVQPAPARSRIHISRCRRYSVCRSRRSPYQ